MQRFFPGSAVLAAFFMLLFSWGCTKIDTTTLGSGLIPPVDSVGTKADTFAISGKQGLFIDSTRMIYSDYHPLGGITNDPQFGTTTSDLYVQLKPSFYPFYFGNAGDTIPAVINTGVNAPGFDSVVLCLSVKSFFGDTNMAQRLSVYQMDNSVSTSDFKGDSAYLLDYRPNQTAGETLLGSAVVDAHPSVLANYTVFKGSRKDSVNNQVRIKLDNSFLQTLVEANRDTALALNGMFRSDSLFKTKVKGFHIKAEGSGNGLYYVSLTDAATRLEVHYKRTRNAVIDTAYSSFSFSTGLTSLVSAQATHLERDRSSAAMSSDTAGVLYIQSTPGSYAILTVPQLETLENSIIHRAEIVVEEVPTINPTVEPFMLPPAYLYLDVKNDTGTIPGSSFKPVYYDLNPGAGYSPDNYASVYSLFMSTGVDYASFGGFLRIKNAGTANQHYYYTFNVSRHVQHIVTNGMTNYKFRLYAPFTVNYYGYLFPFKNLVADGRIKIGNGNNTAGYKMYMRIVYSKI